MPHATHTNGELAPAGRPALARCIIEDGWPLRRAAERFRGSPITAQRWAVRYRHAGAVDMADASNARSTRHAAPTRRERRAIKLRLLNQWGPARIAGHLGMHASTVHRILTRHRMPSLSHLDQATQRAVRR